MAGAKFEVLFFPEIEEKSDLANIVQRAGWYLYPYRHKTSAINLVSDAFLSFEGIPADPDVDPEALRRAAEMSPLLRLHRKPPPASEGEPRSFVLAWRGLSTAERAALSELGWRKIINVDRTTYRTEGSDLLGISLRGFSRTEDALRHSREAWDRLAEKATGEKVYVFGTGPTLGTLGDFAFQGGKAIAINTMVRNIELLDRLDLLAIVAADPIFHAGYSIYAAEFRRHLVHALDRYRCFLIVPLRDYEIYRSFLPEAHHARLIAVPFDASRPYNIDLQRDFYVVPKPNVLTLLVFPIAMTFYRRIVVAGCDGRPRSESQHFWSHDPKSQLTDELAALRRVHPAFFKLDYNDYYDEHIQSVAKAVAQFEAAGGAVESLTPSFIPTFDARYRGLKDPRIVSLDPDAVSAFGHYVGYQRFFEKAAKSRGLGYELFGPRHAEPSVSASFASLRPVFSNPSWLLRSGTVEPALQDVRKFTGELGVAMKRLRGGYSGDVALFMYCGSLASARAAVEVLRHDDRAVACMVLFYLSGMDLTDPRNRDALAAAVNSLLESGKVALIAPTEEFAEEFRAAFGHRLPVLPNPSTTFGDDELVFSESTIAGKRRNVFFPGNWSEGKGAALVEECLAELAKCPRANVSVRARYPRNPSDIAARGRFLESLTDRVEFIKSDMSPEDFRCRLTEADVVVLPYQSPEFRNRTSGLLIDAISCGVPAVVLKGTWLGNVVEKYGCGVAVEPDQAGALAGGVDAVLARYEEFRAATLGARTDFHAAHSWSRLVDVVVASANAAHLTRPSTSQGSIVRRLAATLTLARLRVRSLLDRLHGRRVATYAVCLLVLVLLPALSAVLFRPAEESYVVVTVANLLLTAFVLVFIAIFVMRRFDRLKREAEVQTREIVADQLAHVERRLVREIRNLQPGGDAANRPGEEEK